MVCSSTMEKSSPRDSRKQSRTPSSLATRHSTKKQSRNNKWQHGAKEDIPAKEIYQARARKMPVPRGEADCDPLTVVAGSAADSGWHVMLWRGQKSDEGPLPLEHIGSIRRLLREV